MSAHFEELSVGDRHALGAREVTESEMVAFAERFDPQPVHVDPSAAAESPFGGLVASGWFTVSVTMRLLVDGFLEDVAARGALGVDELRWPTPVRPGDELVAAVEIAGKEARSTPTEGLVRAHVEAETGSETALSMVGLVLVARQSDSD